jgi:hypothetical protein
MTMLISRCLIEQEAMQSTSSLIAFTTNLQ